MDEETAKVPDVEKDWSIEIYLFSNGQQFSPPRKYYLRANELILWETTLNQLAQSHYGEQCPLHLYTTDGQLVEGPLGLKDGQAYVAVAEPDTFVDAGYQRYLMKASRSWEKRQARRKVKDCVPDDPCCLCPEKEWCCNPQTCCECPEIEDSFTEDTLMPATGHPELRSARHFMSSSPAKTVAATDYEPRSRIGPIKDEHAPTKPNEYGANAAAFDQTPELSENRPILIDYKARPNESGAKLGENIEIPAECEANLNDHTATFIETEIKPGELGAVLNENGPKLIKNGQRSVDYETRLGENAGRLSDNVPRLRKNCTKPDDYGVRPVENGKKPGEYVTRLGENVTGPADNETISGVNGAKQGEYGANLAAQYENKSLGNVARPTDETKSLTNGTRPGENRARLGEHVTRLSESGLEPSEPASENETRTNVNSAKLGEHVAKPGKFGAKSHQYGTKPGEQEAKPIGNGSRTWQYGARPGEHETRSSINRAKPDEYRTRPEDSGGRPGDSGRKPSKSEIQSGENVIKSTVNNILKPGHIESWSCESEPIKEEKTFTDLREMLDKRELEKPDKYEITESEQWNKQIESKSKANGIRDKTVSDVKRNGKETVIVNGVAEPRIRHTENAPRPSERKSPANEYKRKPSELKGENEHTRRISGQRGAEIQPAGKTAEPNREFEHCGRLSEQKGRENNFVGRAGGQRVKDNGARLSEQRNTQIDNLARLGSHGGHESRAGDLRMKTIDPDSRLRNASSKVAEPSAKVTAPASRPIPRDRINSKLRTSDLGQFKSGTPVSRINGTAARSGESGIKNTVGNSETRPASAGGNGASRAPHISEGQQNTRRSSLYTGKPSTEKKRLSIGQNSTLLRKPTSISSALKQPIKSNKDSLTKKISGKASFVPIPGSNKDVRSELLPECLPYERITPPALTFSTIEIINQESFLRNRAPLENIIDEQGISTVSTATHSLKQPESEITTTSRIDTVKHVIEANIPQETQTEVIYVGKNLASTSISVEVQTSTEALDTQQHAQQMSATNTAKVNSGICCPCCQRDRVVDPDTNTVPILNKGDAVNLKLNIEVRNIIKSVYSCAKNCQRSQSLTDTKTSEKESQITVDDHFLLRRDSLQSIFCKNYFQNYGFDCSPNVMVVQCAGCGRLNNPPRGKTPQCCENNSKYFVLLTNSVNEDMDEGCNFSPPSRPCDQRPLKKCSSIIPVIKSFSEMTLDTVTTVTLSGVPIQRRETAKCNLIDASCQTEECRSDSMMTKPKVSLVGPAVTTSVIKKKSTSSMSVTQAIGPTAKQSCLKLCTEIHEDSHVSSQTDPVPCEKVPSACSQVSSKTCQETCPPVPTEGCQETCPPAQTQGCQQTCPPVQSVYSTCPSRCPVPLPCIQIMTQVCPQGPQVCNTETQTQWRSLILQARLHCDGRYSFHLPPLNMLNQFSF